MVVNLLGAEANAYFYVAWMMASLLFAIPLATSQSLFAESCHFERGLRENITKSVKFSLMLLVPTIVLLMLIGKWLLLAFGQSYSANSLVLMNVFALSSLPLAINQIYTSVLRVTGRTKELVIIWGFITCATLLSSYFIMPTTGFIGAGYAWLGVQGATAVYVILNLRSINWVFHPRTSG